jgi:hypothetical protein
MLLYRRISGLCRRSTTEIIKKKPKKISSEIVIRSKKKEKKNYIKKVCWMLLIVTCQASGKKLLNINALETISSIHEWHFILISQQTNFCIIFFFIHTSGQ